MRIFKILLLIVCFLANICSHGQTNREVFLSGKIISFDNIVLIEDMSELKEINLPSNDMSFIIDSNGNFKYQFILEKPKYFRIGRNHLYLTPGDSLNVIIDFNKPEESVYEGKNSAINYYLKNTPYPKMGSFLYGEDNIGNSLTETVHNILILASKRNKNLDSYVDIPKQVKAMEKIRIDADIVNSLNQIIIYYPYVHKISKDSLSEFKKTLNDSLSPYLNSVLSKIPIDSSLLQIEVYRKILPYLIDNNQPDNMKLALINDWITSKEIFQKITNNKNKDSILSNSLESEKIKNLAYKQAIENVTKTLLRFGNNDRAKSFQLVDLNGEVKNLSDFEGKIIYIDFWASWCGPCKKENECFELLKKKFKNKEIVFLSLSIDEDDQKWRSTISSRNYSKPQYKTPLSNLNSYAVMSIPRTIIIDKNFILNHIEGPLPSFKETEQILLDLLKKQ